MTAPAPGTPPPPPFAPPSRAGIARSRIPLAHAALARCRLCPHRCEVNRRDGPAGRCHAPATARCFSAQLEVGDELELVPTYAIALSGCQLRCDFCITGESSWNARAGSDPTPGVLAMAARRALDRGARTIMLLGGEPSLHPVTLLDLVSRLPDEARLVLKTNAWFSPDARPLLAGLFNVWLPDLKFGNDACALRLAGIPDYLATVIDNLRWMTSPAAGGGDLIVRHLLMPGHEHCCWQTVADWMALHLPAARVSIREGFWPAWHAHRHPELQAPSSPDAHPRALAFARERGLTLSP